jgi:heterodisulfide reductase subunit A-like polyferredoxin
MLLQKALKALRQTSSARRAFSTTKTFPIIDHTYDALVVGAGGAGLRAAVGLAEQGFNAAYVLSHQLLNTQHLAFCSYYTIHEAKLSV